MTNLGIGARLAILMAIMLSLVVGVTGLGMRGMSAMRDNLATVYADRAVPLGQLAEILDAAQRMRGRLVAALSTTDQAERDAQLVRMADYDRTIDRVWTEYMATYLTPEEAALSQDFLAAFKVYEARRDEVADLLRKGDVEGGRAVVAADNGRTFEAMTAKLKALIDLQVRVAKEEFDKSEATFVSVSRISIAATVAGGLLALALAVFIVRSITRPVHRMVAIMDRLAADDTEVEVFGTERRDEVGHIARAVQVFKANAVAKKTMQAERAALEESTAQQRRADMAALADRFQAEVGHTVDAVGDASRTMQQTAEALSAISGEVNAQASAVAAASAQAASNVQTVATATEEIGQQIGAVQGETGRAVDALRAVLGTIGRMDHIAGAIAAAVEQQAAATREIARNVEQAARGTQEVSENIAGVTMAASEAGNAAGDVLSTAESLARDSNGLSQAVDSFLGSVRAA